jgi:uncharacterized protein YuzE
MQITYDQQAEAMYIYFGRRSVGRVQKTIYEHPISLMCDSDDQIVEMRVRESTELRLASNLCRTAQDDNVAYDANTKLLRITFEKNTDSPATVIWPGNFDFDDAGNLLGVEILFDHAFSIDRRVRYISKFRIW